MSDYVDALANLLRLVDEMRDVEARMRCLEGHDFEHVVDLTGELHRVICASCGRSWRVSSEGST